MAGDWIKVEITTPDKPEVHAIAELLDIDPDAVVGKLFRVWAWADQQTETGHAPSVTKTLLDRVAFVTGFTEAMVKVGWLTQTNDGLQFTSFDRHNGKPAKTRGLAYKRKVRERENLSRTERDKSVTREQRQSTENKSNAANKSPGSTSTSESTSKAKNRQSYPVEFERFWSAYPANDKGRKRGKQTSYTHWKKVPKADRGQLVTAAANYASETTEFIRDPERFLKSDWWRDWIETAEATRTPAAQRFKPEDSL